MKQHELKCIRTAKVKAGLLQQEKFECNVCSKLLKTKAILESHIRLHLMTDEDRTKFKCHICQRGYPSMRSLRSHVLLHTDVAIFQCPMCEKSFKKRNNLQAHIRVHNNSRIFKCTYCEKNYIHSIDRKRHEMAVHTGEVSVCCEFLNVHGLFFFFFQRPFKCQLCNDGFVKRYSLKLHMKKIHLIDTNMVDYVMIEEDGGAKGD
jgi:KRAB domain-containing zinc finger protein